MLHKIIIFLFLTVTFSFSEIVTTSKVQRAQGVGIGVSRSEAVNEAIVEAVGQISGVRIKKKTIVENLEIEDDKGGKLSLNYNAKIDKYTSGKADSYKILNVNRTPDGLYKATVLVTNKKVTRKYKTPGYNKNKRRSIVVVPANLNSGHFNIMGEIKSSINTNINLSQELLNKITQTRKFNVLDREENRAFYNEQNIFKSESAHADEVLKLGNILGSDYILLTSIKDLAVEKENGSKYITNSSTSYSATVTVQFKVITTATRQVKFANTRNYQFEPMGNTLKQIYYDILGQVSSKITTELIENIYPIKVLKISNESVTLNQGNMETGTQFEIYKLGERLVDSYTKESLGRSETKTGVLEITKTMPKYSVAKILEGTAKKGYIIRSLYSSSIKKESLIYEKIGKESDTEIKSSGGVVLPFD